MRKHLWAVCYAALLTAFTVYIALDTFALPRVYSAADSARESGASSPDGEADADEDAPRTEASDPVTEAGASYDDGDISVTLTEYREYDTSIYVADVVLSSPAYLRTAFAQDVYGKNVTEKTSVIASENNAVLAVNGDYCGARESGYVLRNGVLYRDRAARDQEDLVIYSDGSLEIVRESDISAEALLENGAVQVLSFGPALVEDGEVSVSAGEEVGRARASNPRTAIAVVEELHYLFIVSDGRTDESAGLSLSELAGFVRELGAQTAYNLDGGGSSTMVFNGQVVNRPTSGGRSIRERGVSDIVYVGR